ncbi:hypothetical protein [Winogradskyella vidalii]|uniref:hypothetical protein n=1 Tax=Winogradskyella vidalii TaxID=2615024 RepID=UPI0015C6E450|nr:hypothetical protein [Winogradskyella vidalii]
MNDYLHQRIPNLIPFSYAHHHDSHLINQQWVLINGISKKKAVYTFKADNILEISRKDNIIETSWTINIKNTFTIKTEDGVITVDVYFKDDDILVLNNQDKEEFALYINTTNYEDELNSIEDVQAFLKEKYKKKVSTVIHDHQFYYIEKAKEYGPFKVEELAKKVKADEISAYCFVRDVNAQDYSNRIRIADLIQEL